MTVSNGDVIQAVVDFVTGDDAHFQNKWVWVAEFLTDQTDAAVLAAILSHLGDLYDLLTDELPAAIDDPECAVDVVEYDVDSWEVAQRVGEGVIGTTLTGSADVLPYPNSAYMYARTARPRSSGRKFFPPFGEDQQAGGYLIASATTAMAAALTEWLTDIAVTANNDLVPGVASTVTGTFLPFQNGFVRSLMGTQRRRRQGYGI